MFFFNNVKARNYVGIYEIADAFYDLERIGFQARLATTCNPGDTCIVATTAKKGQVKLARFELVRVEIRTDDRGKSQRVFRGRQLESESISKAAAARDGLYSIFFDKNGHFKRHSVLQR